MRLNHADLYNAVKAVARAADHKSAMPILGTMRLRSIEGGLQLSATDLSTWVTTTVYGDGGDAFDLAVTARDLADALKAAAKATKGNTVTLDASAKGTLLADMGPLGSARFPTFKVEDLPKSPPPVAPDAERIEWDAEAYHGAMAYVLPAVCLDVTRFQLNGVCLVDGHAIATDGHRLHLAPIASFAKETILSLDAVKLLTAITAKKGPIAAWRAGQQITITDGAFRVVTRAIDSQFPPYEQVIPKDKSAAFYVDLSAAPARAFFQSSVKHAEARGVRLGVNGAIKLVAENAEGGSFVAEFQPIYTNHEGPDYVIGFDPRYIVDALKVEGDVRVRFGENELDPIKVTSGARVAVIMPMRV